MYGIENITRAPSRRALLKSGLAAGFTLAFHLPVRAANDEAVEIVSVSATNAIPSAPATSSGRSETGLGTVSGGNPFGSVPTNETPWSARLNADDAPIATTTAISTPGTFGNQRLSARIRTRLNTPIATAAPTASPEVIPFTNARASLIRPLASVENPNSFGSCPIRMVSARPFM